jgi:hypothetical protein
MPIFQCSNEFCKAIENTSARRGNYFAQKQQGKDPVCSECLTGKWLSNSPKRTAEEAGYVRQEDGFYGRPENK